MVIEFDIKRGQKYSGKRDSSSKTKKASIRIDELIPIFKSTGIFSGMNELEIEEFLATAKIELVRYGKDEIIFRDGEKLSRILFVVDGEVKIFRNTMDGNRHMITNATKGEMFAEVFPFTLESMTTVNAISDTESVILYLSRDSVIESRNPKVIFNMMNILCEKNKYLQKKLDILSAKKIRDKILIFLELFKRPDSQYISVPFNREEMADFISSDRSSLSRKLSNMKKEGIIDYDGNSFKILISK